MSPSKYLTVAELSEYLQIHRTTIYRMLREGRLPGFRIGSDWRFSREAIDEWVRDQMETKKHHPGPGFNVESGQGTVEFALSATILLMLMFAIFEMSMVVYSYNTISHAARECVRYAIVHSPTGPNPATTTQIKNVAVSYADLPAPNQLTANDVAVSWPADPNLPSEDDAQCNISLNYNLRVPFLPSKTLHLTASARMLVAQ